MSHSTPTAITSICHPTDFSRGSEVAFEHALRIALAAKAELSLLHVDPAPSRDQWAEFPGVRETLERWGHLPAGSKKEDVAKLGVGVRKIVLRGSDAAAKVTAHLEKHPAELIVLASHQRDGLASFFRAEVSSEIARSAHPLTLFVPYGCAGFVDSSTGDVAVNTILIPIARKPSPQRAADHAAMLISLLGLHSGRAIFLHVGEDSGAPHAPHMSLPNWKVEYLTRAGNVEDTIASVAEEVAADVLLLATEGKAGFLDMLRGSTTERVLRHSRRPIVAINVRT